MYGPNATAQLACTSDCLLDTRACNGGAGGQGGAVPATTCGNNIAEGNEICDGADLRGQSCITVVSAASTGVLRCAPNCTLDVTACTNP